MTYDGNAAHLPLSQWGNTFLSPVEEEENVTVKSCKIIISNVSYRLKQTQKGGGYTHRAAKIVGKKKKIR